MMELENDKTPSPLPCPLLHHWLHMLQPFILLYMIILIILSIRIRILVGKPEGKRPVGRPRRRWIDNIKMDLLEIGLSVFDWIGLAQDRYRWRALVNAVMNLRVP
jgi:hypothetical protein